MLAVQIYLRPGKERLSNASMIMIKSVQWHSVCVMLELESVILKVNSNSRMCYVNTLLQYSNVVLH